MLSGLTTLLFILFLCFVFTNWSTPNKNKRNYIVLALLLPFSGFAQDTLYFDYYIHTTGPDSLVEVPAMLIIEEGERKALVFRSPYEYYSRYIVAEGLSMSGDKILFFAGCDKVRFTENWQGKINGAFLTNRGSTIYLGLDPELKDKVGWSNKQKF